MKEIDADYYGYRDDDDGILIPLEEKEEKKGNVFYFIFQLIHNSACCLRI